MMTKHPNKGMIEFHFMASLIITVSSLTIFLAAFLLFSVQPMIGKMVLPLLGGTPQVWNTCMFFFQIMLLAGYAYAHFLSRFIHIRRQVFLHILLLLIAIVFLPIKIDGSQLPPTEASPIPWLLLTLVKRIGLVFLLIAASSPLIQKWFSKSGHRSARDPYFLYAASNLGSLMALLSYPFLIEPILTLKNQSHFWSYGYTSFILVAFLYALLLRTIQRGKSTPPAPDPGEASSSLSFQLLRHISRKQKLQWLLLSFIPVSLMYGVTTHLSTDVSPFPLLWIIPLSIYLITFILAFSKRTNFCFTSTRRAFPFVLIPLAVLLVFGSKFRLVLI